MAIPRRDGNVISMGDANSARQSLDTSQSEALITLCRSTLTRLLAPLVQDFFENVDDALFEMADAANNNNLQSTYFDAMREVRKERRSLDDGFTGCLLARFDWFWRDPSSARGSIPGDDTPSGLSLVEDEDLEESLAISGMIDKGNNRFQGELFALNQRLAFITNGPEVDNDNNPVGPRSLCNSFREATEYLNLDVTAKLVVFKLFDRFVLSAVGNIYSDMNNLLAQSGILPQIAVRSHRNSDTPVSAATGSADGEVDPAAVEETLGQPGLFKTLQNLLAGHRGTPTHAQQTATDGEPAQEPESAAYNTAVVLQALSMLQHSVPTLGAGADPGMVSSEELKKSLIQQLNAGSRSVEPKQFGQAEEDAIDVVAMIFDFILEDRNLPDAMKALISRLQIPMLKIAILDKEFFSRKTHPARRLLNEIAQAGIGWSEESRNDPQGLYAKVESVVERIHNDFSEDQEIFSTLLNEFQGYIEKENRGSNALEKRTLQVSQGKEQLEIARLRVKEEIGRRVSAAELPQPASRLLTDAWKDVLLLIYLRHGSESAAWDDALKLADKLVWSVEPKKDPADREKLLRLIPVLLKAMREGLANISYEPHKMETLFRELQECHLMCLRGDSPLPPTPEESTLNPVSEPDPEADCGPADEEEITALPVAEEYEPAEEMLATVAYEEESVGEPDPPAVEPPAEEAVPVLDLADAIVEPEQPQAGESLPGPVGTAPSALPAEERSMKGPSRLASISIGDPVEEFAEAGGVVEEIVLASSTVSAGNQRADTFDIQARDMGLGTWIEFLGTDGSRLRAKLAWKSQSGSTCVFVNRKGAKVEEKTFHGLAAELRRGTAVVLDNVPLMDRALEAMMNALQRPIGGQTDD